MSRWLYSSRGHPVAFVDGGNVFTRAGEFLGVLRGRQVWNGWYIGEIIEDDRLATRSLGPTRPGGRLYFLGQPCFMGMPDMRGAILFPLGYRDLELPCL